MGNILLPKIEHIDFNTRASVLKKVDTIIRNEDDIEKALNLVDQEILVNLLKIDYDICKCFRLIWKKMQKRRLGRR